jgi:uncharacterized protein YjiK
MTHVFWILMLSIWAHTNKLPTPVKIKPIDSFYIPIPEPSDIAMRRDGSSFFVVSDDGFLFEMSPNLNVIRKADFAGFDCEAVYVDDQMVYVVEEFTRKIRIFDIETLTLQRTVSVPYGGGRNKGFEAFTFNTAKGKFVMLTEKDPIYLLELDSNLQVVNEIYLDHIASDISSATWHDNHLWLLSDEDMMILKMDPLTYQVLNRWKIPVINPEGLVFINDHTLWVVSDDMERVFVFSFQ